MIKKNNQTIDKIYKGTTEIAKIYKGSTLVYENYRDMIATGNDIINITKAKAGSLNYLKASGKCEQTGTPTPTVPIPIWCNNGELKVRHQSGLPTGYQRVRYIYSTESIDLGIKTTDDTELECLWFNRLSTSSGYLYRSDSGSALTTNTTAYVATQGNWRFGAATLSMTALGVNINVTSTQNKEGVWWNDTKKGSYTNVGTFESTETLKLFTGGATAPKVAMSWLKVSSYATKELQHYWIACRRESDGKLGVYDIVGKTFYTNDDATITAGADATDPIEIYADGTVETIAITGKNLFDKNNVTDGYFYDANLEYTTTAIASLSGFIPVVPGEQYTISWRTETTGFNVRVNLFNENKEINSQVVYTTSTTGSQTYTITVPDGMHFVRYSFRTTDVDTQQFEPGSTATTYETFYNGGTATTENLLSVGDYEDAQEVISGDVTRNVEIKVLDGSEDWSSNTANIYNFKIYNDSVTTRLNALSTHFQSTNATNVNMPNNSIKVSTVDDGSGIFVKSLDFSSLSAFTQYLADQYNAGTPVIVVYPLATPTTETATAQPMNIQKGTNIIEVTEASLDNLELEVKYKGK